MEAIEALRKRAFSLAKENGAALRGKEAAAPGVVPGEKITDVTKSGTIIYGVGKDAVRDDGESFRVGIGATLETDIMALRLAQRRFGDVIGDNAFHRRMIKAAVEGKVSIKFAYPFMERQRNELFIGRYQERKEHENKEQERQRKSHEQKNAHTDIGTTAPHSWIAADLENFKRTRNDGKAEKKKLENEPKQEKPRDRGLSR